MSQSGGSTTDTQALLQSMLQRLKLQPGTERLGGLHPSRPDTADPTWGQNGLKGSPSLQAVARVNNISVNGFGTAAAESAQTDDIIKEPKEEGRGVLVNNGNPQKGHEGRKWDSRQEFEIPAWDGNVASNPRGREGQQPSHGGQIDKGQETMASSPRLISSPSYKDNSDTDRGENTGSGQADLPALTPTGQQLFPAKPLKDADVTLSEGTEDEIQGEKEGNGNSAMKKCIPCENFSVTDAVTNAYDDRGSLPDTSPLTSGSPQQSEAQDGSSTSVQGFTPRVYVWSLKTTETSPGTGSEDKKTLLENGGSKDTEVVTASQKTVNGTSEKQPKKTFETKTRWTQKIKMRWAERRSSFGKKREEAGGRVEMKNGKEFEFPAASQPPAAENLINMTNKQGERTQDSVDRTDPTDSPTLSEDCAPDSQIRSFSDLEFSLGPFSLMEEILTGQEWAKFLNPALPAFSTNQRSSEQPSSKQESTSSPQGQNGAQSPVIPNQPAGVNNHWNFRGSESTQVSGFSMAPDTEISADVSVPARMDISEPMEHSQTQAGMESEESGKGVEHKAQEAVTFKKPADVLDNLALNSRVLLNRKRAHHSQEKGGERLQAEEGQTRDKKEAETDESQSSPRAAGHETEKATEEKVFTLHPIKSSLPSPSSSTPPVRAPRSVLKHSISQDSESSLLMETVPKKRRVEETRRVHFSEQVISIPAVELDLDGADSEEDSGTEEESVLEEEEAEMEQTAMEEEVAPAPRPALPAWILALKRRKTGRKLRH